MARAEWWGITKDGFVSELAQELAPLLAEQVQETIIDARNWPVFEGRTTVRKNPGAPMPIARGAYRDVVDSGEFFEDVHYEVADELFAVGVPLTAKNAVVLQNTPVLEVADNEFPYDELIDAFLNEVF